MAKKNFIDGLDSIFDSNEPSKDELVVVEAKEKKTSRRKSKSSKDFTADLDTLLQEALQESVEKHTAKQKTKTPVAKSEKRDRRGRIKRTLSGLDALIRQTMEVSEEEVKTSAYEPKKKRLTFSFDRDKIEKLKNIARMEKSYIKDIVNEIVSEYIDEYEKSKK